MALKGLFDKFKRGLEKTRTSLFRSLETVFSSKSKWGDEEYEILEEAARFFVARLKEHPPAIEYLKNRGLSGEIAHEFGACIICDLENDRHLRFTTQTTASRASNLKRGDRF